MKKWFESLAPRERLLVMGAALVVIAGFFFLVVWAPLHQGVADLEQRIAGKQSFAAWMAQIEAEAAALRQQGGRETIRGRGDSLLAVVDQTSRDAGLSAALQRIQPQGQDKATVTLDDAGFDKLLRWLRTLEQSYGIVVQALSVTREDKPGTVQARLTLQRSSG